MDRASDYGSEGYRFKSCRAHHTKVLLPLTTPLTGRGVPGKTGIGSFSHLLDLVSGPSGKAAFLGSAGYAHQDIVHLSLNGRQELVLRTRYF
jgi:hypothetical protein